MSTLYRKYRPQVFADLIGQEHLITTLTNEIISDKIAHAYLFSGPRGIGKTTMARLLAKAANCENRSEGKFEPCNTCASCLEITNSRNIDVVEIDAASHTGVDNVRENIIENTKFKPTKSKYKIFIIDEAHMLSISAFNALLKTLEEPPEYVIFILATTENQKLPATIISRCQRFNFKKISEKTLLKRLEYISKSEGIKVEKEVFEKIISKSEGCVRDAESLLGQIFSLNQKKITLKDVELIIPSADAELVINLIDNIGKKNLKEALIKVDSLVKEGVNLEEFLLKMINILRLIMIIKADGAIKDPNFSSEDLKKINILANFFEQQEIISFIDKAIKRKNEIKNSPIPQLPLELLIIEFANSDTNNQKLINDNNKKKEGLLISDEINNKNEKISTQEIQLEKEVDKDNVIAQKKSLDSQKIKEYWVNAVKKISETFPSLTFILQMAEVAKADTPGCINLFVPYSFHKEKIEESRCKRIVEETFSDLIGTKIAINCQIKEVVKNNEDELENLIHKFGGEVVD